MIDQLNLFEHWNFNSRSLPGEREGCRYQFGVNNHFNSRPCVRSDFFECFPIHTADKFQFSLPVWERCYQLHLQ